MRSIVLRLTLRALFLVCLSCAAFAQESSSSSSGLEIEPGEAGPQPSSPISAEVASAETAIAAADWKTAEARLDSWLAAHPADARALFDAGYVADVQNRQDDAASLYRRAVQADAKSFEAHLMLGLLLARKGILEEARTELAAATQLEPGEAGPELKARAWRALARIDSNTDPGRASDDLMEALKLAPETADDTLLAASLAENAGQYDTAEAAYRRVLAKDPKSEQANAGLAHILILNKQYAEAETLIRSALQQSPDDAALTAQLAAVLIAEDKAEALPLLEKLHSAHPADVAITRMLAAVLSDSGDTAGSDKLYLTLLASAPKDPDLLVAHGENLVRLQRFAEAYTVLQSATQLAPSNSSAWSDLAFAASRTSHPDDTVHALTERSRYLPENASTYFLWATAYDSLHETKQAISYYHRFLEASAGKYPNQEWQARQRLRVLEK
jgi:tetratricopeptide (TPR) repeat protein